MLHSLKKIYLSTTDYKGNGRIPMSARTPGMIEYVMGHWSKKLISRMGWWGRSLESRKEDQRKTRTQNYASGKGTVYILKDTDFTFHFESQSTEGHHLP